MAVFHLTALAKERIGFVKEQDHAARLRGVKDAPQILFGFADIFADHTAQVDPIEIEAQLIG